MRRDNAVVAGVALSPPTNNVDFMDNVVFLMKGVDDNIMRQWW